MTKPTEISIVDIVSEGRYKAMFALHTLFKSNALADLSDFTPLVGAMQGLPDELIDTVGVAIIVRFFEENALSPESSADRKTAAPFAHLIATNINSAAQAIIRQMQAQQEHADRNAKRLMTGTLAR